MTAGTLETRLTANTSGFEANYGHAASVVEAQSKKMQAAMAYVSKALRDNEAAGKRMAESAQRDMGSATAAAEKLHGAHAGVGRELIVLAHEMSQGNFSKFGGSMLVLAERINLTEKAATLAGAATIGLGVAVLGAVAEIAAGAIEADRFNKSLQLTGNYAAVTADSIKQLAEAQAKQTGRTVGASRESIEAVAGSGRFDPSELAPVARAMSDFQKLSGATAEEALKDFVRLQDGVAKWAAEENRSMHFLTLAQYEHIKALEDAGDQQQAMIETVSTLAGALESRGTPAVGLFAKAWQAVKDSASAAAQVLKEVGTPHTVGDSISDAERQRAWAQNGNSGGSWADRQKMIADADAKLAELHREQFRNAERLSSASAGAGLAQAAIDGKAYEESILRQGRAVDARTEALKKWDAQRDKDAAAGTPMSAENYEAGRKGIIKSFTDHSADAAANEYASLIARIKEFNAVTDIEAARLAPVTEGQKFLLRVQQDLASSASKLTHKQKAAALADAEKAGAARDLADAEVRAQKAIYARVQADTANQQAQQALVDGVVGAANDQANAIYRQIELIGKSADEAKRIQALHAFDDMFATAMKGADSDTVKRLQEVVAARGNVVQSLDAEKAAHEAYNASFTNGFDKAFDDYRKQSENAAAFGEKVFQDGAQGMTDALVQFAMTGKLSFKSLIDTMIQDLLRFEIQKGASSLLNGGADFGALGSAIGNAFDFFPTFANGLDHVPYDGFIASLHEGETITRKQDASMDRSKSGQAVQLHTTVNIGQGVSRAEATAGVQAGMAKVEARMRRLLETGKVAIS